jgi:hypothetical protein
MWSRKGRLRRTDVTPDDTASFGLAMIVGYPEAALLTRGKQVTALDNKGI